MNPQLPTSYHVMTKPIGPICNLDCKYCFYLEKEVLFPTNERFRMSDDVLETYIRQYIEAQGTPEVSFAWQGGEPTLLGVDYFRKVVELQKKHGEGRTITNALQTNGTMLDDEWCEFLSANGFLVGLSIDGPPHLHDYYRVDKRGRPSSKEVMRGASFLKKHGTEFNTLTVVNKENGKYPLEVYHFLKKMGSGFMQFIPLVERRADEAAEAMGLDLAGPPEPGQFIPQSRATAWSVGAEQYGDFLIAIFEEWVRNDVGRYFVQMFDVALGAWSGAGASLCVFSPTCGDAMALEHNGDLYACDHYVYPKYKLGNIMNGTIKDMALSEEQRKFGRDKADSLPKYCRECEVRFACHGECPKHRFTLTPDGEPGLNYLCPSYKKFFNHVDPYMRTMTQLLRNRRPPAEIMQMLAQQEGRTAAPKAERNDPCPCGSGKKFKKCCGAEA